MDWSAITSACQNLLVVIVLAIISALGIIGRSLIKNLEQWLLAKINAIDDDASRKTAASALATIDELAISTVNALEQEYGKAIRESIEANDGKFTREDLVALHAKAVEQIEATLTDEAKDAVSSIVDDLQEYIKNKVSSAVFTMKSNK